MSNPVKEEGYLFSKGYTRYVFSLLFLLYMFDYMDRMIISALFPYLKVEYQLTDAELGRLVSVVYWSIVALVFPASLLVDRYSRKRTIGAMATIWSVATAACALTKSYTQLFVARMFIGVGESGYAPGGTAMISAMYPEHKRSWIMGIWNASIPLGSALGVALGGIIASIWGWRHAIGLVALPGLIVAILFFFVRDYKTVHLEKKQSQGNESGVKVKMKWSDLIAEFLSKPSLIYTYFGFVFVVFVTTSLLTWLPSYFSRVYDLAPEKAATKASLVMLLALVGAPLGGYITDRWRKKRLNARLVFPGISTFISAILVFIAFILVSGTPQYIVLLCLGIAITSFIPAAAAVTQDLVHPGLRASSYAIAIVLQNLLGASLGSWIIGKISDLSNIQTAMSVLPIFLVIASLLFFIGSFYYRKDLLKVEKVHIEAES